MVWSKCYKWLICKLLETTAKNETFHLVYIINDSDLR